MAFTTQLLVSGAILLLSNFIFADAEMWCPLIHVDEDDHGVMKYVDKLANKAADKFVNRCPGPLAAESRRAFCCYMPGSGASCCDASQFAVNVGVIVVVIAVLILICRCCCCSSRKQPPIIMYHDTSNVPLVPRY